MKNYAERFESLEDLPISEEMLGAYIEGNLDPSEEIYVSEYIDSDPTLYQLTEEARADYILDEDDFIFPEEDFANLSEDSILLLDPSDDPELRGEWDGGGWNDPSDMTNSYIPNSELAYDPHDISSYGPDIDAIGYSYGEDSDEFYGEEESADHESDDPFASDDSFAGFGE